MKSNGFYVCTFVYFSSKERVHDFIFFKLNLRVKCFIKACLIVDVNPFLCRFRTYCMCSIYEPVCIPVCDPLWDAPCVEALLFC